MAEKLKVFKNVNAVSAGATRTFPIITTTSTSQAVVKNVSFKASDPLYTVTGSVMQDGFTVSKGSPATAGTEASDTLSGSQIVDVSSSLDFVIATSDGGNYVPLADAFIFAGYSGISRMTNTSTTNRMPPATYDEIESDFFRTIPLNGSGTRNASSAFGWLDGNNNKRWSRCDSNTVYTYDVTGASVLTNASFTATTKGVCTDGTYFYGKSDSNNTTLERRLASDGSNAGTITMSQVAYGQASNQGSFTLYYGGFVYVRKMASATTVAKINVTTGDTTTISVPSVGSYSIGALITVGHNGVPYLLEKGTGTNNMIIDLNTETVTSVSCSNTSVSTEYGNHALEIAPGVAIFPSPSSTDLVWIDANTMTASSTTTISSQFGDGLGTIPNTGSIANIPLHLLPANPLPTDITYSLYADGVEITGV
jgi:hypothetical protein